jgi:hypothetical protein
MRLLLLRDVGEEDTDAALSPLVPARRNGPADGEAEAEDEEEEEEEGEEDTAFRARGPDIASSEKATTHRGPLLFRAAKSVGDEAAAGDKGPTREPAARASAARIGDTRRRRSAEAPQEAETVVMSAAVGSGEVRAEEDDEEGADDAAAEEMEEVGGVCGGD